MLVRQSWPHFDSSPLGGSGSGVHYLARKEVWGRNLRQDRLERFWFPLMWSVRLVRQDTSASPSTSSATCLTPCLHRQRLKSRPLLWNACTVRVFVWNAQAEQGACSKCMCSSSKMDGDLKGCPMGRHRSRTRQYATHSCGLIWVFTKSDHLAFLVTEETSFPAQALPLPGGLLCLNSVQR